MGVCSNLSGSDRLSRVGVYPSYVFVLINHNRRGIETFHLTLNIMLKLYCSEQGAEWDEAVYPALFAIRDTVVESLRFSRFQLVYGHEVQGPLLMLKEQLTLGNILVSVEEYLRTFKERLEKAK